jgi:cystathionine beta-synthase
MQVFSNILEMVGKTPMLELKNMDTGTCQLFLKLELANPGGSIKDRIGISMIEEAEKRGDIKPGDTLLEATAGNTGLGLALVAAQKGYKLILVLPDKMSQEKIFNLRAMGAEVVLTRSDVGKGHPEYYQDVGKRLAKERRAYFINQFGNPDNPLAHERTTAPEILEQMNGDLDAIVIGVGSSGTVTGISNYLEEHAPNVEIILADPVGSVLSDYVNKGELGQGGSWLVEGIGEDFIPSIADFDRVSKAYPIRDFESFATARRLLREEGILAGSSTGTLLAAALARGPGLYSTRAVPRSQGPDWQAARRAGDHHSRPDRCPDNGTQPSAQRRLFTATGNGRRQTCRCGYRRYDHPVCLRQTRVDEFTRERCDADGLYKARHDNKRQQSGFDAACATVCRDHGR